MLAYVSPFVSYTKQNPFQTELLSNALSLIALAYFSSPSPLFTLRRFEPVSKLCIFASNERIFAFIVKEELFETGLFVVNKRDSTMVGMY